MNFQIQNIRKKRLKNIFHPIGLALFLKFIGLKHTKKYLVGASRENVFLFKQLSGPMHERTPVDLVVWLNLRVTRRLENT